MIAEDMGRISDRTEQQIAAIMDMTKRLIDQARRENADLVAEATQRVNS